jgi:FixJ family two-component response regulator
MYFSSSMQGKVMRSVTDKPVSATDPIVYVVDDDPGVQASLSALVRSVGLGVKVFESVEEFLAFRRPDAPGCLVIDVRLKKGESGLVAHDRIASFTGLPIIFMSAYADVAMCVRAMKGGALDFIEKPFLGQRMLDSIAAAVVADGKRRELARSMEALRRCFENLTSRERDVMSLVAKGLLNKQIAAEMNLSEMTIKIHRMRAMRKMEARSFADFVLKAAAILGPAEVAG